MVQVSIMAAPQSSNKLKSLIIPVILSVIVGISIYYGGEGYQLIGLEGLGAARVILGYILGISEFLILATLIRRMVQYLVFDWLVTSALGSPAPRLLSQLASFIIYLFAIGAIVSVVFKKDLTVILAASGAAGIVVGMALRELILDVFAGLSINLDRVIKIGDIIQISDPKSRDAIEGEVQGTSWRTTQLLDNNKNLLIIPNSRIASSLITNMSLPNDFVRTTLILTIDVAVPVDRVVRILHAAAIEASAIVAPPGTPEPIVGPTQVTRDGVEYKMFIFPSVKLRNRARLVAYEIALKHLSCAGIQAGRRFNPTINQLAKLIGNTLVFQCLTATDRELLVALTDIRRIPPKVFIANAGEVATSMFLIVEGLISAETTRRDKDGKIIPPKRLGPGRLIGGEAMLLGDTYEVTVRSDTAVLLYEIDYPVLGKFLNQKPDIALQLSQHIAKQLIQKADYDSARQSKWQMNEEQLATEVLRNLRRAMIG